MISSKETLIKQKSIVEEILLSGHFNELLHFKQLMAYQDIICNIFVHHTCTISLAFKQLVEDPHVNEILGVFWSLL